MKCLQCHEDILREDVLVETWRSRGATLVRIVHVKCGYVLRDGTSAGVVDGRRVGAVRNLPVHDTHWMRLPAIPKVDP